MNNRLMEQLENATPEARRMMGDFMIEMLVTSHPNSPRLLEFKELLIQRNKIEKRIEEMKDDLMKEIDGLKKEKDKN